MKFAFASFPPNYQLLICYYNESFSFTGIDSLVFPPPPAPTASNDKRSSMSQLHISQLSIPTSPPPSSLPHTPPFTPLTLNPLPFSSFLASESNEPTQKRFTRASTKKIKSTVSSPKTKGQDVLSVTSLPKKTPKDCTVSVSVSPSSILSTPSARSASKSKKVTFTPETTDLSPLNLVEPIKQFEECVGYGATPTSAATPTNGNKGGITESSSDFVTKNSNEKGNDVTKNSHNDVTNKSTNDANNSTNDVTKNRDNDVTINSANDVTINRDDDCFAVDDDDVISLTAEDTFEKISPPPQKTDTKERPKGRVWERLGLGKKPERDSGERKVGGVWDRLDGRGASSGRSIVYDKTSGLWDRLGDKGGNGFVEEFKKEQVSSWVAQQRQATPPSSYFPPSHCSVSGRGLNYAPPPRVTPPGLSPSSSNSLDPNIVSLYMYWCF